jgi:hypothetical protein
MVMLFPMYRTTNVDDHIESLRRFKEVVRGSRYTAAVWTDWHRVKWVE